MSFAATPDTFVTFTSAAKCPAFFFVSCPVAGNLARLERT
jgi:hypothetical protein